MDKKREIGLLSKSYMLLGFNWDAQQLPSNTNVREVKICQAILGEVNVQYQLMLHEKGNKRLNTLTILQAIFVPLTLIAGIYGMNFSRMPELKWPSGYFLILGFMGLIVLIELWWFRRKGWFD